MINGKPIDKVYWRDMMKSIQRMEENGELKNWYICDEGQLMTDFVEFSGVLPAQFDSVVSYKPIKSYYTNREYQWYCRIHDEEHKIDVYFTALRDNIVY